MSIDREAPGHDDGDRVAIAWNGDVHRTLIDAGAIPDPFEHQQEKGCAWVEGNEWWYRFPLRISEEALAVNERRQRFCHGLQTFAVICLDGEEPVCLRTCSVWS